MIICCLSVVVCKRRISVRHFVVTDYSYSVSCQITQAVIRISPPLLIGRAPFKSAVDNTYAFTIEMEVFILFIQNARFIYLFISSYLHFMNPVNLCGHRRGRHIAWCVAMSFVTFSLAFMVLKRRRRWCSDDALPLCFIIPTGCRQSGVVKSGMRADHDIGEGGAAVLRTIHLSENSSLRNSLTDPQQRWISCSCSTILLKPHSFAWFLSWSALAQHNTCQCMKHNW